MLDEKTAIRAGDERDHAFIYATWLRSYRHDSNFARKINNDIYYEFHHKVIERILERASIQVLCSADDPYTIFGYLVWEVLPVHPTAPIVHYLYIKMPFRKMGLGKELFTVVANYGTLIFTHYTSVVDKVKNDTWLYNPYLI